MSFLREEKTIYGACYLGDAQPATKIKRAYTSETQVAVTSAFSSFFVSIATPGAEAVSTVSKALNNGIKSFDTGPAYTPIK